MPFVHVVNIQLLITMSPAALPRVRVRKHCSDQYPQDGTPQPLKANPITKSPARTTTKSLVRPNGSIVKTVMKVARKILRLNTKARMIEAFSEQNWFRLSGGYNMTALIPHHCWRPIRATPKRTRRRMRKGSRRKTSLQGATPNLPSSSTSCCNFFRSSSTLSSKRTLDKTWFYLVCISVYIYELFCVCLLLYGLFSGFGTLKLWAPTTQGEVLKSYS